MTQKAHRTELFDVLSYPARIEPTVNANVLAEVDGVVAEVKAPLGKKVARHERLLVIRHTDPVYQYAPVIVSSPVSGVVSSVDVTEGSLVTHGQRLASVTDPTRTRIVLEAAAADLASLRVGLEGKLRIAGREPVAVKMRGISPFVDPATGTATCQLAADPRAALTLAPGLVGQVSFQVNQHQGYAIPEHAVVYRGVQTFLRVVEKNHARYVAVELGRRSRGLVEITKGIGEGAEVIERAGAFVADGEQVEAEGARL